MEKRLIKAVIQFRRGLAEDWVRVNPVLREGEPGFELDEGGLKVNKLGNKEWLRTKARVKKNLREVAQELIELYAKRQKGEGFAFSKDTSWQRQFEDNFPTDLFKSLFTQNSPWVQTLLDYDREKSENVNKYFITQI